MRVSPTQRCMVCGKGHSPIDVPDNEYWRWQAGDHIQTAMPSVSASDREVLITGIHGSCFDAIAPEE